MRILTAIAAVVFCLHTAAAQHARGPSRLGIGGQVGTPTGLTAKYYGRRHWNTVFLVSWNLDRFLLFSSHVTFESPIPDSPLRFFIGPGIFVFRPASHRDLRIRYGVSLLPGLNFFTGRFEVFLQTDPGLRIAPHVGFSLGGAVGLRYYL